MSESEEVKKDSEFRAKLQKAFEFRKLFDEFYDSLEDKDQIHKLFLEKVAKIDGVTDFVLIACTDKQHKVVRSGNMAKIYGFMDLYKRHFFIEISRNIDQAQGIPTESDLDKRVKALEERRVIGEDDATGD